MKHEMKEQSVFKFTLRDYIWKYMRQFWNNNWYVCFISDHVPSIIFVLEKNDKRIKLCEESSFLVVSIIRYTLRVAGTNGTSRTAG